MFLFTHGDADYTAELILPNQVRITRTVETCVAHPKQKVTQYHDLTYPDTVYNVCINISNDSVDITLANDHEDRYSYDEIVSMFTGEDEDDDESVDQIKDSDEYYMPNYEFDNKYVEKFLKHNQQDNVNHPAHYKSASGLEAIDVIDAFTEDLVGAEAVCTSQVLKYTLRWKHKNGLEDLKKAEWYLNRLIKKLERRNSNEEVCAVE